MFLPKLSVAGASALLAAACSSSTRSSDGQKGEGGVSTVILFGNGGAPQNGSDASAVAATGGKPVAGTSTGGAAGATGAPTADCKLPPDSSGCVGELYQGETLPFDIYIMFDQSGSMSTIEQGGVTRMAAVSDAIGQFLQDPASAGLGVGIGYFGQEPIGKTTCDPADYTKADVPIAAIPQNAPAIEDSLSQRAPTGETPTASAIRGACTYATQWKTDHPARELVLLFVTDGLPEAPVTCSKGNTSCCPTLDDAVKATTDCLSGTAGVKTYVLGVGPYLDNLAQIATAGGTGHAYLVDGGDVSKRVLAALNAIRISAQIPCQLSIPKPSDGKALDYTRVNLVTLSSGCEASTIPYRETPSDCGDGGWYFDSPSAPQTIFLCKSTCDAVSLPGAQLDYSIGCARGTLR